MHFSNKIEKLFRKFFFRIIFYGTLFSLIFALAYWPPPLVPITLKHNIPPPLSISPDVENFYTIYVNGVATDLMALFIKDKKGKLWLSETDFKTLRIIIPSHQRFMMVDGQKYYSIDGFPGLSYQIDPVNLIIRFKVSPQLYPLTTINAGGSNIIQVNPPQFGMFLNYDLFTTRLAGPKPKSQFTGFFQIGYFNEWGVGTTSFINQTAHATESLLRLFSTWRYDKPEDMWTLSVGDTVSAATSWSGSVNYAGIQWGTNFETQPAFVTFPQPDYAGQATVPSVLDLYINGALSKKQPLSSGPFLLNDIPYVNGQGEMGIVMIDAFGKRRAVTLSFYVSNQLLKTGLVDYTYEIGILRQNLGLTSLDYSRYLVAATKAYGVTDDLTTQWHIEGLSGQETVGYGINKLVGNFGILNLAAAGSLFNSGEIEVANINSLATNKTFKAAGKVGGMLQGGFQRQTPKYSFGGNVQTTSFYFTQQAIAPGNLSPSFTAQLFGGFTLGQSSIGLNYIRQINRFQEGINLIVGTFSRNIFWGFNLSVSGTTNLGGEKNKGVFFTLTRSLGLETSASLSNSIQNGDHIESLQIQRNLPPGPGYGYLVLGQTGTQVNNKILSGSLQNDIGTYTAEVNQFNGQTSYSLEATGAAVLLNDQTFLTRNLNGNSFAVIQTPGFKDVDVYWNNQLNARTNKYGNAIIPNLLPYQETEIKIDPNKFPINVQIDKTAMNVIPYYSSGVIVKFPVKTIQNVTFIVKQSSGEFVPEGASVMVNNQEVSLVGADGQVYLTDLSGPTTVNFVWEDNNCQISFSPPPSVLDNPMPDLGILTCRGNSNAATKKTQ